MKKVGDNPDTVRKELTRMAIDENEASRTTAAKSLRRFYARSTAA